MKQVYMLVGLPGAGKTTYVKKQAKIFKNIVWLSSDEIRKEMFGGSFSIADTKEVFKEMSRRLDKALSDKSIYQIYYDATNLRKEYREDIIKYTQKKHKVDFIAIDFKVPMWKIYLRNWIRKHVDGKGAEVPRGTIKRMSKTYTIPTLSEGFARIIQLPHKR